MNTKELATKYGVVLPETSEEMNWHSKPDTAFYWHQEKAGYEIIFHKEIQLMPSNANLIPAPQMHDIAPWLPMMLDGKKVNKFINRFVKQEGLSTMESHCDFLELHIIISQGCAGLSYLLGSYFDTYTVFNVDIENNQYAEAYAQMYIQLKTNDLIL